MKARARASTAQPSRPGPVACAMQRSESRGAFMTVENLLKIAEREVAVQRRQLLYLAAFAIAVFVVLAAVLTILRLAA